MTNSGLNIPQVNNETCKPWRFVKCQLTFHLKKVDFPEFVHWLEIEETKVNKQGRTGDNREQDNDKSDNRSVECCLQPIRWFSHCKWPYHCIKPAGISMDHFRPSHLCLHLTSHHTDSFFWGNWVYWKCFTDCRYLGKCLTDHLEVFHSQNC